MPAETNAARLIKAGKERLAATRTQGSQIWLTLAIVTILFGAIASVLIWLTLRLSDKKKKYNDQWLLQEKLKEEEVIDKIKRIVQDELQL